MHRNVVDQTDLIRILHVDDDMSQGEFLKYFLPDSDGAFSISAVNDPNQALNELRKNRFDCVVTDYVMPELNGIELATLIRKEYDIPIIIYTGHGSEEVAEAAFSVGIDDYMRKEMDPSHYQVLAKRIRSVVEKKRVENLYRGVIEQTRDALSIFINNKIVFANKATLDLLEVKRISDIVKDNPFDINFENMSNINFQEKVLKKKNKNSIYVEISTSKIIYNGNIATLCFARDITEKKVLENEKKFSQERFRNLVQLSPDGICSVNPLGFVTFANNAFLEISGFSEKEILGKHLTTIGTIRKKDILRHLSTFASIIKGEKIPPIEFTWNKKSGEVGLGKAHISFIEINGTKEVLLIAKDITNLRKKEKEFEILLSQAPFGIVQLDAHGNIININDVALKYTELNKNNVLGNNFSTVFNIEEGELTKLYLARSLLDKEIRSFEYKIGISDASVWIEAYPMVIEIDEENYGVLLIMIDITNKKRLEKERKLTMKKIENLMLDIKDMYDSQILSYLKKDVTINLEHIAELLDKIKIEDNGNNAKIIEVEESISNIFNLINNIENKQLVPNSQIIQQIDIENIVE